MNFASLEVHLLNFFKKQKKMRSFLTAKNSQLDYLQQGDVNPKMSLHVHCSETQSAPIANLKWWSILNEEERGEANKGYHKSKFVRWREEK
jgi:hypothetical protein